MKFGRKFLVVMIVLAVCAGVSFVMPEGKYSTFVDAAVWLSGAFFLGNSATHWAQNIGKRKGE